MRGGHRQNAGRKKGFSAIEAEKARELISRKLSDNLEPIVEKLISQAKNGDIKAIRELFDRAYGKSPQNTKLESVEQINGMKIYFDNSFDNRLNHEEKDKLLSLLN